LDAKKIFFNIEKNVLIIKLFQITCILGSSVRIYGIVDRVFHNPGTRTSLHVLLHETVENSCSLCTKKSVKRKCYCRTEVNNLI